MLIAAPPPRASYPGELPTTSSVTACEAMASVETLKSGLMLPERRRDLLDQASCRPKGRRRLHAQTRPASAEHMAKISRRRRSPSGCCSGCLGGAGVPVSHMSLECMAVRTKELPRRRRLSPRGPPHHRTTPARTRPRCTTSARAELHHGVGSASRRSRSRSTPHTPHTTHSLPGSLHHLPLAVRFHSNARAPADTFLVPARSPRKTRPSRRPPRSARPLVRPTSFMRTTMPRSPPAKAPSTMSRLRCAQSRIWAKGRQQPAGPPCQGDVCGNRADRPCLHPPRHAAVLSE